MYIAFKQNIHSGKLNLCIVIPQLQKRLRLTGWFTVCFSLICAIKSVNYAQLKP